MHSCRNRVYWKTDVKAAGWRLTSSAQRPPNAELRHGPHKRDQGVEREGCQRRHKDQGNADNVQNDRQIVRRGKARLTLRPLPLAHQWLCGTVLQNAVHVHFTGADHPVHVNE